MPAGSKRGHLCRAPGAVVAVQGESGPSGGLRRGAHARARPQVLKDLQENPKASQHHLRNPQIMAKIQKLVTAGIVRMS